MPRLRLRMAQRIVLLFFSRLRHSWNLTGLQSTRFGASASNSTWMLLNKRTNQGTVPGRSKHYSTARTIVWGSYSRSLDLVTLAKSRDH
jgi:hypothetical protein